MQVGPDFVRSVRYGMLLNVLFVCMSYSAGMPALHFVSSAFCLFTYLFDKVLLLRVARLPPQVYTGSLRPHTLVA